MFRKIKTKNVKLQFSSAGLFAFLILWLSHSLNCFLFPIMTDEIYIKLAKQSLLVQTNLARDVSKITNSRIYLFDNSNFFDNADVVIYNSIRTLTRSGKVAVLSQACQSLVGDSSLYKSLIPPEHISSDSIGVYLTHSNS
uniref:ORF 3 n=1 Tax=Nasturtium officinale macula-like virus 1 TaxID=2794440 RepID=A0A7T5UFV2_9VIRU|nr:ORF 3 [Nasturtium officinale macula-like virus 1]